MFARIVVGTDGSPTAAQAVETAYRLAAESGAEVHVVTAWTRIPALAFVGGPHPGNLPVPDDGSWVTALHEDLVMQGVRRGLAVMGHAVENAAPAALLDVARDIGADLVVVGNRGMSGLRGKLGSVPNTVAHKAPCAVLVVPTG